MIVGRCRFTPHVVFSVVMKRRCGSKRMARADPPSNADNRGVASTMSVCGMAEPFKLFHEYLGRQACFGQVLLQSLCFDGESMLASGRELFADRLCGKCL